MRPSILSSTLRSPAMIAACLGLGLVLWAGCSQDSSSESASKDTMTADVGNYPPAPEGITKPRVGVPPFAVTEHNGSSSSDETDGLAADEMTTLLDQTDRFHVIERAQFQALLNEQGLKDAVKPGELAQSGQIHGVDYLLLGKVTNLRVKKEKESNNFGLATVGNIVGAGDVQNSKTVVTTECGVDIRLVDPTSGEIVASNFCDFKRTDSASSMGIQILGADANSNADIDISEDDKGKILRLALDEALRKTLPKIDHFLESQPKTGS